MEKPPYMDYPSLHFHSKILIPHFLCVFKNPNLLIDKGGSRHVSMMGNNRLTKVNSIRQGHVLIISYLNIITTELLLIT